MQLLAFRLRAEARTRMRSWLGLAVVAGLVGGATVALLAGARRTETAYARFLDATRSFDVLVTNGGTSPENTNRQFDIAELARLPEVADIASTSYDMPAGTTPAGKEIGPDDLTPLSPADGRFGAELNRARVLDGRLPRGQQELALTLLAADSLDLHVGDTVALRLDGPAAVARSIENRSEEAAGPPSLPLATKGFRIVGILAMQGGFQPLTGGLPPLGLLSPEYATAHPDRNEVIAIRLRRGTAAIAGFERTLERMADSAQVVTANKTELGSAVQRGVDVQATALLVLGILSAALALPLLGQALARQAIAESRDHHILRAVGATGSDLRSLGVARAALIGTIGGIVAGVTAIGLSPLSPVGLARPAEIHPGMQVDATYVGAGTVGTFLVVAVTGSLVSLWSARRGPRPASGWNRRSSRLAAAMARIGFGASAVSGSQMALEPGSGSTAVPVRSTIVGVTLGVATLAALLSFSGSLRNLLHDPRLYGWNWDVQIGDAFAPDLTAQAGRLDAHPAVTATAVGTVSRLRIDRLRVDTLAIESIRGTIEPTVVEGRVPRRPTEIMLGNRTLADLGRRVGDAVTVVLGDRSRRLEVVGRGVLSEFAGGARLGEGAAMTLDGMRKLQPDTEADVVLLRLRPGPASTSLLEELADAPPGNVYLPVKPSDLVDLERVGGLPFVVASLLALMGVATMAHTLMMSVRRRRRDMAILKMLGFLRGQVAATVAWQSSVVAAVAIVAGVPLGLGAGRWAWQRFADELGVPPRPSVPVLATALLVPATLVLANLVAALPARLAARTVPTVVFRTE